MCPPGRSYAEADDAADSAMVANRRERLASVREAMLGWSQKLETQAGIPRWDSAIAAT